MGFLFLDKESFMSKYVDGYKSSRRKAREKKKLAEQGDCCPTCGAKLKKTATTVKKAKTKKKSIKK